MVGQAYSRMLPVLLALGVAAALVVVGAPPADGQGLTVVWEVTTTDDHNDGICDADCTLREAVNAANNSNFDDWIVLQGGYYLLTIDGLFINDDTGKTTILGPGIIDGNGLDGVLGVWFGSELVLQDVTITGGNDSVYGGGIHNSGGTLTLIDVLITGNTASYGGGIYNWGEVTVFDSTITGNHAAGNTGGGIYSDGNGTVAVTNSVITGNTATYGGQDCVGALMTEGAVVVGDATACDLTPLHVDHTTSESGGVEVVARLESDINPQLIFTNSGAAALEANGGEPIEWFHAMTSDGEFKISRNGTNTVEAKFFSSGDLVLAGALTQNSDVNEKTGIVPVDPVVVLERVRDLEVSSWSYAASPGVSHVGPMAQDFYASFGVGADPTGIAAIDADGVALAAIQALAAENEVLAAANTGLAGDVRTLQLGLSALGVVVVAAGVFGSGWVWRKRRRT